jgi:uncharacterized membrane protein YjjB (DUF3815 family)
LPSVLRNAKYVWLGLGVTRAARIRNLLLEIIASIATWGLVLFATHHGGSVYRELGHIPRQSVVFAIVGLTTTLVGFLAHWFKRKNQRIYGRVEMAFGMVPGFAIASAINPERPLLPQCVSLVGCAYVIARGLNNISDANAKALAVLLERLRGISKSVDELSLLTATLKAQDQTPSDQT